MIVELQRSPEEELIAAQVSPNEDIDKVRATGQKAASHQRGALGLSHTPIHCSARASTSSSIDSTAYTCAVQLLEDRGNSKQLIQ